MAAEAGIVHSKMALYLQRGSMNFTIGLKISGKSIFPQCEGLCKIYFDIKLCHCHLKACPCKYFMKCALLFPFHIRYLFSYFLRRALHLLWIPLVELDPLHLLWNPLVELDPLPLLCALFSFCLNTG